jgi:FkbH-like protein
MLARYKRQVIKVISKRNRDGDPVSRRDVVAVYKGLLRRQPSAEQVKAHVKSGVALRLLIRSIIEGAEFRERHGIADDPRAAVADYASHDGPGYFAPRDLRAQDAHDSRVLLVGGCFLECWPGKLARDGVETPIDYLLLSPQPPAQPPHPFESYAFQIGQIQLRGILFDDDYAEWVRAPHGDPDATRKLLDACCGRIDFWLDRLLIWSDRIPVFVTNFWTPQYDLNGRLFGRSAPGSNKFIVDQMNRHLESRLIARPNVHVLDLDHLAGVYGRRFVQDDSVWTMAHGSLIDDNDWPFDQQRIIGTPPLSKHYRHSADDFIHVVWSEAEAMFRSLRRIDEVKMVCVDLDDTLWRGVLAETDVADIDIDPAVEGWPLGVAEALLALRRRGVVLALVSKNDLERIRPAWTKVFSARLRLEDFAILKVNWNSKASSVGQAMREANLLPRNVVFLDDNPAERAAVAQAFPDLRIVEASHYYWKRILMWSPETQGAAITAESARRNDMIKSQILRESERAELSRSDFLAGLQLRAKFFLVEGRDDARFPRMMELLNKTNQFNTTGRRWTVHELEGMCRSGAVLVAEAADRHAEYGLVLVALASGAVIEQVVMSCRVIGLDVEIAALSWLSEALLRRHPQVFARARDTDANLLSRDLFKKCGWVRDGGDWRTDSACAAPDHLHLSLPSNAWALHA